MRITHCDGPGCERTTPAHFYSGYEGWITLEADEDDDHAQLCSWSCLAALATSRAMEREALQ